ncbi:hypothetical protein DN757_01370 [Paenibacillus silvae]|uniref:Uncharacterized protein n=1 Tax=Paenibacillus silvae TaxID=1325358 RepID=A0A2W6NN88_9BACL|nr:hypothetical protein DN757_01370 [Paenibacillus silvae]
MYSKYGWRFESHHCDRGTFLIGVNFNTNDEWGKDERESYINIYLGKWSFTFGKFHYRID